MVNTTADIDPRSDTRVMKRCEGNHVQTELAARDFRSDLAGGAVPDSIVSTKEGPGTSVVKVCSWMKPK